MSQEKLSVSTVDNFLQLHKDIIDLFKIKVVKKNSKHVLLSFGYSTIGLEIVEGHFGERYSCYYDKHNGVSYKEYRDSSISQTYKKYLRHKVWLMKAAEKKFCFEIKDLSYCLSLFAGDMLLVAFKAILIEKYDLNSFVEEI